MQLSSRDIHSHLLPGVDDGFQNEELSLRAIGIMAENGCKKLALTPHVNPDVNADMTEDRLRLVYEGFVPKIPKEWGLSVSLAAEYMVVSGFEERASKPDELLTFEDRSILIEMSYMYRSRNMEKVLFELNMAGLKPIVAHPERYPYMMECLEDFEKWHDMGCRFQLNFMSLTGKYGISSIKIMKYLFKHGLYDFVSTDLHGLGQLDAIISKKPCRLSLRKYKDLL